MRLHRDRVLRRAIRNPAARPLCSFLAGPVNKRKGVRAGDCDGPTRASSAETPWAESSHGTHGCPKSAGSGEQADVCEKIGVCRDGLNPGHLARD
jgi:hypothetical protein